MRINRKMEIPRISQQDIVQNIVQKNKKTTGWSVFLSAPEKTFPTPANFNKLRTRVGAPRKQIFRKNCHRILNNRAVSRLNFLCPLFAKNFLLR